MSKVTVDSYRNYSGDLVVKLECGGKQILLTKSQAEELLSDVKFVLTDEETDCAETTRG